jgi:hypothetical protein
MIVVDALRQRDEPADGMGSSVGGVRGTGGRAISDIPDHGGSAFSSLLVVLVIVVLKGTLLYLDAVPRFFLGDSAAYLRSAFHSAPSDRSWAYGRLIIKPTLALFGSLQALIYVQVAASLVTALVLFAVLRVIFRARPWIAGSMSILYAVEPLSLQSERFVMTESISTFFFALFVAAALLCVRNPRPAFLAIVSLLSAAIIALRVSFLPVVLASCLVLPMAVAVTQQGGRRAGTLMARLLLLSISVGSFLLCHYAYLRVTERAIGSRTYNSASGLFLLAAWAPLVDRRDFGDETLANSVLTCTQPELRSRRARPAQLYWRDGLIECLRKSGSSRDAANRTAHEIALRIARRAPSGVVGLAAHTYADYWADLYPAKPIGDAGGNREVDDDVIELFSRKFGEDISGHHLLSTLTTRIFSKSAPWICLLLLTPALAIIALIVDSRRRREIFLLAFFLAGVMVPVLSLATEPVPRYLHPVAWLALMLFGIVVNSISDLMRPLWKGRSATTSHATQGINPEPMSHSASTPEKWGIRLSCGPGSLTPVG